MNNLFLIQKKFTDLPNEVLSQIKVCNGKIFTPSDIASSKVFLIGKDFLGNFDEFYNHARQTRQMLYDLSDNDLIMPFKEIILEVNDGVAQPTWLHLISDDSMKIKKGVGLHFTTSGKVQQYCSFEIVDSVVKKLYIPGQLRYLLEPRLHMMLSITYHAFIGLKADHIYHDIISPSLIKQRLSKSKLYEYHELKIRIPNARDIFINQHENLLKRTSPRVHEVRAHRRKCCNGKVITIGPFLRGDKSRGMIVKDYNLCH